MNSWQKYFVWGKWTLCLAVSLIVLPKVWPAGNDLFTEVPFASLTDRQANIVNELQRQESTINLRVVRIEKAKLLRGEPINFNLFAGVSFTALESRIQERDVFDYTWYGRVSGEMSNIFLTVYKDAVVGFISVGDESYNLRSLGGGLNVIIHVDPSKYPSCGNTSSK